MSDRIIIDPDIQHGKPVIRGTRVPISRIIGGLAGDNGAQPDLFNMTTEMVIKEFSAFTDQEKPYFPSC